MSMSTGSQGALNSDPNVTPMIDVLMVLLIIFMIIVPSSRKAIDVQVPDPNPAPASPQTNSAQIVLSVLPGGQFKINQEEATAATLGPRLKEVYEGRPDKIIFIKGDPAVQFQQVIQAMDMARGAGVKVIGFTPKDAAAGS